MTTSDEMTTLAQDGLAKIEEAILGLLEGHPQGLGNSQMANMLGLRSSFKGGHKNHLTHSVLGGLLARGLVEQDDDTKLYTAT